MYSEPFKKFGRQRWPCVETALGLASEKFYDKAVIRNWPSGWYLVSPSGRSAPSFSVHPVPRCNTRVASNGPADWHCS